MNAVVFYSNTGHSIPIARYLAQRLGYPVLDIESVGELCFENLLLVFPVHCQNLPAAVASFLKRTRIENLSCVATYGRMCRSNVLYEIKNKYRMNLVAGAYVPTGHSYVDKDALFDDFRGLDPLIDKVKAPSSVEIPRLYKNPFASLFPGVRSRIGVKIYKSHGCNECGVCSVSCPLGAIKNGVTNRSCIRCLRCVSVCPSRALHYRIRLPMKLYLRKKKDDRLTVYV